MPSLTPSALVAVAISPSSPNLDEVTKSTCHAEDHRPKGNARVSGGPAPGAASALSSELVCPACAALNVLPNLRPNEETSPAAAATFLYPSPKGYWSEYSKGQSAQ